MVSRVGPIVTLLLLVDHFGPIRGTIKSTEAVTGTEEIKTIEGNRIPKTDTVP